MFMAKPSDVIVTGGARDDGLRFIFVDVTDSARALARGHLAGPAAAGALAEGLVAVAILGTDLSEPEETVSLYMKTDGPIESLLVEASFEGCLRGFTAKKILNDFDGLQDIDMNAVFGSEGDVNVMRSVPGQIRAQTGQHMRKPRPVNALYDYYTGSEQRIVGVSASVLPGNDGPDIARGVLVELMPDGNSATFERVVAEMNRRSFYEAIESASGAMALCDELGLGGIVTDNPRPLRFACRCSRDRALSTLRALPKEELDAMKNAGRPIDIYCHMCGRTHTFKPEELDFGKE